MNDTQKSIKLGLKTEGFDPTRPPLRELSSAERAAMRAAAVRGHLGDAGMDEGVDDFYIDRNIIPEGWDYQWKRQVTLNQEDPAYAVSLRRKGWEPVPTTRHRELMPEGTAEQFITRKGMVLMERPMELTIEAQQIEQRRARLQVRAKEEQLTTAPPGQFDRSNKDNSLLRVKKAYEAAPIPVPSDA